MIDRKRNYENKGSSRKSSILEIEYSEKAALLKR